MKTKNIITCLLFSCIPVLAYAGDAGNFKIPIKVSEDPCLLTAPTVGSSEIKVSELKEGYKGDIELSFNGCTAGESVDIQATATSEKSSAINVYLAKDSATQDTSVSNIATLSGLTVESSGTTTGRIYYKIQAVDKSKPTTLVGDSNINIALTYTYQ